MKRELKDYCWELIGNKIKITNKKTGQTMFLSKVGWTSLHRFAISAQDRLRIEQLKTAKNRPKKLTEQIKKLKEKIKLSKVTKKHAK